VGIIGIGPVKTGNNTHDTGNFPDQTFKASPNQAKTHNDQYAKVKKIHTFPLNLYATPQMSDFSFKHQFRQITAGSATSQDFY
jgi:hypothetical protein